MSTGALTNPSIDRAEHDANASAKRILPVSFDMATGEYVKDGSPITSRYDISGTTIYTGSAVAGTSEAGTGWTIYKYDLSTNPYTGKVAIDVSWSDRATGTYT